MASPLFTAPSSLREPRERRAFVLTLLLAFPAAAVIGFFVHERIGESEVALFIVIAMVYVTLARGRLIGSSVMIHEAQYPRVFSIVKGACAALDIPMPLIFVREDNNVPVAALGFGEPYSLVLSSRWIEQFEDDELAFIVGRQLGHIAAGHTRYLSLLSVNGNENPIVALVFGAWLRSCDFTCDKVGLLVCGSLDSATRAIAVASFHHFGRQVNTQQFAEQGREIARDGVLKWGEWLGAEPYATRRIAKMETFQRSQQYESAREWFLREHAVDPPELPSPGQRHVERTDCAGWWRRFAAAFIDLVIIAALVSAFLGGEPNAVQQPTSATVQTQGAASRAAGSSGVRKNLDTVTVNSFPNLLERLAAFWRLGGPIWLVAMCLAALAAPTIYFAVLVGLAGQTFGMMIVGLRVVTTDFRQPGFPRALWRYTLAYVLWWLILPLGVVMHRVMLHDLWSGTRLIAAERILARSFAPPRLA